MKLVAMCSAFVYMSFLSSAFKSSKSHSFNPQRGGGGELDNFEKSLTNSPPIGKNFVSKIPQMGHQICYII